MYVCMCVCMCVCWEEVQSDMKIMSIRDLRDYFIRDLR